MYEFEYQKPASLDDVTRLLGDEDAKLVAGGMTLIPTLKLRLAKPTQLIDLGAIPSLKGITDERDAIVIGAMTRHAEVNRSDVVKRVYTELAVIDVTPRGFAVVDMVPGLSLDELQARTDAPLHPAAA